MELVISWSIIFILRFDIKKYTFDENWFTFLHILNCTICLMIATCIRHGNRDLFRDNTLLMRKGKFAASKIISVVNLFINIIDDLKHRFFFKFTYFSSSVEYCSNNV